MYLEVFYSLHAHTWHCFLIFTFGLPAMAWAVFELDVRGVIPPRALFRAPFCAEYRGCEPRRRGSAQPRSVSPRRRVVVPCVRASLLHISLRRAFDWVPVWGCSEQRHCSRSRTGP